MTAAGFQVSGSAPRNYQQFNAVIMAPFVEAVIAGAGVGAGDEVLDVACGTGLVARRVAEVVGESGSVVGLDVNPGMLATARSLDVPSGATIAWSEASALDLPFADGRFSAVVCQQGVQFFPDLGQAAAEMARVAAPGARIAVSFWATLDDQTYMRAQADGLRAAIGEEAAAPLAGAFRLSPETMSAAFVAAGLRDISAEELTSTVSLPPMDPYAAQQVSTLPVAPAFAALTDAQRQAYVDGMGLALAGYRTPEGRYDCPFATWVVTARK